MHDWYLLTLQQDPIGMRQKLLKVILLYLTNIVSKITLNYKFSVCQFLSHKMGGLVNLAEAEY